MFERGNWLQIGNNLTGHAAETIFLQNPIRSPRKGTAVCTNANGLAFFDEREEPFNGIDNAADPGRCCFFEERYQLISRAARRERICPSPLSNVAFCSSNQLFVDFLI